MLCGATILALVTIRPPHEKIAIFGSTFGLLSILAGIYSLDRRDSLVIAPSMPWLPFTPLLVGIAASLLGLVAPPPAISAFIFAIALTLLFLLSRLISVSRVHIAFSAVLLAASIGYNVFCYYSLISGIDTWGYLSVASAIVQRGHYFDIIQPVDRYYFPFPILSIDASTLSSVTGLSLELSLLLSPGILILLQPLLIFLLSRLVFGDVEAASLSALIVVTESMVTQWISGPIAQSAATSLSLLFLILLFGRVRSGRHVVAAFVVFLMLVAMHGAVGLVCTAVFAFIVLLERSPHRRIILPLVVIYSTYVMITEVMDRVVQNAQVTVASIFEWIFTPTLRVGTEFYGAVSNGLIFIWWGLPVSLALFSTLLEREKRGISWVYTGLGLLGLSFVINVIAPRMAIDRYGGLTAWLILATTGGKALRTIAGTRRQLVALVPIILLVCSSAVVDPALSPQYGFYEDDWFPLPMTKLDKTALDWVNRHVVVTPILDIVCASYLIFSRYRSGTLDPGAIERFDPQQARARSPTVPGPDYALFVRSSTFITRSNVQPYNIIYNNGKGVIETS